MILLLYKPLSVVGSATAAAKSSRIRALGRQRRVHTCAWYSMLGSCRLLRQIAHVSVKTFHDHTATAFHFLTRNLRQRHQRRM